MSLADDLDRALSNTRTIHIDHVRALGASPEAIVTLGSRQLPFGVDRIDVDDAGRWWPDEAGKPALVVPVIERGEPIDIVAFRSNQPARWWWRIGIGGLLGSDVLNRNVWPGDELRVVSTPIAWICAAGEAVCILDWDLPDPEISPMRDFHVIKCDTEILASRLRKRLAQPRKVPPISVPKEAAHAA